MRVTSQLSQIPDQTTVTSSDDHPGKPLFNLAFYTILDTCHLFVTLFIMITILSFVRVKLSYK